MNQTSEYKLIIGNIDGIGTKLNTFLQTNWKLHGITFLSHVVRSQDGLSDVQIYAQAIVKNLVP